MEPLISSTFKDHSADIHISNNEKTVAFVSNRSGIYQIWLKKKDELHQLTNFNNENNYITDIVFSLDGNKILFKLDEQLNTLDLSTKKIIKIPHPSSKIKNAIWSCDKKNEIIVIAHSSGVWDARLINLDDFSMNQLINGVTSIQGNCSNQQYIVTKQNQPGLYVYNFNKELFDDKPYFSEIFFHEHNLWSVSYDKLYRLGEDGKYIVEFDILSRKKNRIDIKNKSIIEFKIKNNHLIFNDLPPKDTFIGKITIPDLEDTMILK